MRILFIAGAFPSPDKPNWGAFNYRAVKKLQEKIDFIQVLHVRAWRPGRPIWQEYQMNDINVWCFSFLYAEFLPKWIKGILISLYKSFLYSFYIKKRKNSFDLIHSTSVYFGGVVGAFLSKMTCKKHIAQCIGSDINISIPEMNNYIGIKGFERHVDIFACNSIALENTVKLMYPDIKTLTIYRGVNLSEFSFQPIINETDVIFLYIGGLPDGKKRNYGRNLKGGITLLKAWRNLIESKKLDNLKIKLLFGGPNVSAGILTSIIMNEPSNYSIEIIGQVKSEDVKEYMANSSIILVPSMAEGIPNVAMEAASTGRPVIASKVGGIPELVIDNQTGLLFESANIKQLENQIIKLANSPKLIKEYGLNARMHMENCFSNEDFINKYLQLYFELLN